MTDNTVADATAEQALGADVFGSANDADGLGFLAESKDAGEKKDESKSDSESSESESESESDSDSDPELIVETREITTADQAIGEINRPPAKRREDSTEIVTKTKAASSIPGGVLIAPNGRIMAPMTPMEPGLEPMFEGVAGPAVNPAAFEYDPVTMADKPWRRPDADPTDYFNYGFTEESWRMYAQRQAESRRGGSGDKSAMMSKTATPKTTPSQPGAPGSGTSTLQVGGATAAGNKPPGAGPPHMFPPGGPPRFPGGPPPPHMMQMGQHGRHMPPPGPPGGPGWNQQPGGYNRGGPPSESPRSSRWDTASVSSSSSRHDDRGRDYDRDRRYRRRSRSPSSDDRDRPYKRRR